MGTQHSIALQMVVRRGGNVFSLKPCLVKPRYLSLLQCYSSFCERFEMM